MSHLKVYKVYLVLSLTSLLLSSWCLGPC